MKIADEIEGLVYGCEMGVPRRRGERETDAKLRAVLVGLGRLVRKLREREHVHRWPE